MPINWILGHKPQQTIAKFIRKVYYLDSLANVIGVKKANGKWRMCVDFTDLNKDCPKDSYPLPHIDQLVDLTAGHQLLNFMDAFSGYNQIKMDEVDQEISGILDMEPPRNIKEIQSLTGRVAALNRFISKATNKYLPFFKVLKKPFEWTDKCQKAFQDLKVYLTMAPMLSPSIPSEESYLYLAVSPHAVSSALIREEGKVQNPIYHTS